MDNLFEYLEKTKKPYTPDEFDKAMVRYVHTFHETYPLPWGVQVNKEEVIKDIDLRIKTGEKKEQKPWIDNGTVI